MPPHPRFPATRRVTPPLAAASFASALLLSTLASPASLAAQDPDSGGGLRLMSGDVGLAIGHVPRVTGLRINWSDREIERVTGVNITLWRANDEGVGGVVRGLAIGSVPQAGRLDGLGLGFGVVGEEALNGLHVGLAAAVSGENAHGIGLGGLAVVGGSDVSGIQAGGLASVAGDDLRGIQAGGLAAIAGSRSTGIQAGGLAAVSGTGLRGVQAGGLAAVAGSEATGVQLGGLATVAGSAMRGLQLGGLATVAGGETQGIQAGGLAVVSGAAMDGLQIGGLATVAGARARGVHIGGLATVGGSLDGIQIAGVGVAAGCEIRGLQVSLGFIRTEWEDDESGGPPARRGRGDDRGGRSNDGCDRSRVTGLSVTGLHTRTDVLTGLSVATWLRSEESRGFSVSGLSQTGLQVGLSIAVVNWVDELDGVQLGLINRAANNPHPFKVLPLLNANLGN